MWSLFDRWRRGRRATPSELLVARCLLGGDDPRLDALYHQIEAAPGVIRTLRGNDSYELYPEELVGPAGGDFSIPIPLTDSAPLELIDERTRQRLSFQVKIGRRGSFYALIGRTMDGGTWPKDWAVNPDRLAEAAGREYVRLPSAEEHWERVRRFLRWLGYEREIDPESAELLVYPPATREALDAWEAREARPVSAEYRSFLETADGVDVGELCYSGVDDLRMLDETLTAPEPLLMIADLAENGALALKVAGTDPAVYYYLEGDSTRVAGSVRADLRESLARLYGPL